MRYYLKLNVVGPCINNKAKKSKFSRGRRLCMNAFMQWKKTCRLDVNVQLALHENINKNQC